MTCNDILMAFVLFAIIGTVLIASGGQADTQHSEPRLQDILAYQSPGAAAPAGGVGGTRRHALERMPQTPRQPCRTALTDLPGSHSQRDGHLLLQLSQRGSGELGRVQAAW